MKTAGIFSIIFTLYFIAFQRNIIWMEDISLWEDTLEKTPNKIRTHINLGVAYMRASLFDKSLKEYEKANKIIDNFYSHYNTAIVYEKKGLDDIAIMEFKKALILAEITTIPNIHTALAQYMAARLYIKKDLVDEVIANINKAIQLHPDFYEAHNDLGIAYGKKGIFDKAIDAFRIALQINPYYAVAHYNLGITYEGIGLYKKALDEYQIALKLDPIDEKAKARLNLLQNKRPNQ